jgi:two-component system chemotaxis response regulator CheY
MNAKMATVRAGIKPYPAYRTPTVLVLEDSASIRELLALHLSNAGYEVLEAEDAVVAGKMVLQEAPDLIIADIKLPYMSGVEFISALRTEARFRDIPVVFLSSQDQFDAQARELRAAAYLTKPVSLDRLLEVVEVCVQPIVRPGK